MKLSNYGWQLWNSSFLIKFDKLCVSNLTCIVIKQISNLEPILWPIRQNSSKILKTNECMGDNNHNSTISWPLFIQRRKELSSHVRYVLRRQNYHLILIATPFFPLSHLQSLGHLRRSWHSKKKKLHAPYLILYLFSFATDFYHTWGSRHVLPLLDPHIIARLKFEALQWLELHPYVDIYVYTVWKRTESSAICPAEWEWLVLLANDIIMCSH